MESDCATTMDATASAMPANPAEDRASMLDRYSSALVVTASDSFELSKLRALKRTYGFASHFEVLWVGALTKYFRVERALRKCMAAATKWPESKDALICVWRALKISDGTD